MSPAGGGLVVGQAGFKTRAENTGNRGAEKAPEARRELKGPALVRGCGIVLLRDPDEQVDAVSEYDR
jgi:hypothetical protein